MNAKEVLAKFTRQMRQEITYPDMQQEVLPRVIRFTRPAPAMSTVLYSDLNEANAEAEIEEQIAFFQVWGGDFTWIHARHSAHLAVPGYLSIYVAYVADAPACAGWIYYPPSSEFASLWGGSTIPAMRNKGLYTAVLTARVQEAIRCGRRYLVIDAGFQSCPIVERHGFVYLTDIHACEYTGFQAFTSGDLSTSN